MSRRNPVRGSLKALVVLALFSLPFAAAGVGMTLWLWHDVLLSREIKTDWHPVPAVVRAVEMERHYGKKKRDTTYETKATYAYTFEGRTYESSRLGLSSGADNIGDYQKNLYSELRRARETRRPVTCWVNPADPTQAVLRAAWRPEMVLVRVVLGLVFGAVGLGLLAGAVAMGRGEVRRASLQRRHAQEPWLWRAEWQGPALQAPLKASLFVAVAVLGWIHVVTAPLWQALPGSWATGGAFKWVLSAVLLLVLVASGFCVRTILHARKYRGARLELDALPLRPGAPVRMGLFLPQALSRGAVLSLALVCLRKEIPKNGKRRTTTTTRVWTYEQAQTGPLDPGSEIVFRCDLPVDAPQTTSERDASEGYGWVFEAKADVPGVDLNLKFEVPVFADGARTHA